MTGLLLYSRVHRTTSLDLGRWVAEMERRWDGMEEAGDRGNGVTRARLGRKLVSCEAQVQIPLPPLPE
jgi:hypothetical protein